MLRDSDLEKWVYREHTRVKHVLLEKYLRAWIPVLGKWHKRICYFDGFAGRGEYVDGTLGSPLIAMKVAEDLHRFFGEFICVNIEKDPCNYANLEDVIKREKRKYPHAEIINIHGEFASVVSDIIREVQARLVPSFFLIDPFGFSGVPFEIVKDILSIPRTEVFFTFMYREIARFLKSDRIEVLLDELFGTRKWREIAQRGLRKEEREHALRSLYIQQLRKEAGVRYPYPFRVCTTEKVQTLYYLIHATNNFKGHFIMKGIMYNQGAKCAFAYLGPDDFAAQHQVPLFDPDSIPDLKTHLLSRFAGRSLTYEEVEEESYMETPHIDKHYRRALKELEREGKVKVTRVTSRTVRGLRGQDRISFG